MNTIPLERFSHWLELDGPEQFLHLAENPPADCPHHMSGAANLDRSFTGTDNLAEALDLARKGWKDAPDLRNLAASISANGEGQMLTMQHAVTGAFVDVSRYLEGHPENMLEFSETPAPRSIKIGVNMWNHAGTSADVFHYRGAIGIALADAIARSGMNCEIFAVNMHGTSREGREDLGCTIFPIKRAHEPLDIDAVSFWACHPSALRRIGFFAMDHYNKSNRWLFKSGPSGSGYGRYFDFGDGLETNIPGIDLLINCKASTEAQAAKYLERYAAKLQS